MVDIVCPSCGMHNDEGYVFCTECGAELAQESVATVLRPLPEEMPVPLKTVAPLVDLDSIEALTGSMPQTTYASQSEDNHAGSGSGPLGGVRLQPIVGSVDSPPRPTFQPDSPSTMVFGAEMPEVSSEDARGGSPTATPRLRPLADATQPPVHPPARSDVQQPAHLQPPVPPVVEPVPASAYVTQPPAPEPVHIAETIVVSEQSGESQVLKTHPSTPEDEDPDSPTLVFDEAHTVRLTRRNSGQVYEFDLPAMVGKGTKANVMISGNRGISREHAEFELLADEPFVRDNDSSNGTFVNEMRIDKGGKAHLADGDIIRLANEEFEFSIA